MENKILYIAISVGLLVFAFFIISGNFTGRMGSVYRTCTDSDSGKEPMKRGVVYYSSYEREYEYADYCFSKSGKDEEKWLNEYYCDNNEVVYSKDYNCKKYGIACEVDENGIGACINATQGECIDSDGLDYFEKGSVCLEEECKVDLCRDEKHLTEATCEDNQIVYKIYECPSICTDGKCVEVGGSVEEEEAEGEPIKIEEETPASEEKEGFGTIMKKAWCKIIHSQNYENYEDCVY